VNCVFACFCLCESRVYIFCWRYSAVTLETVELNVDLCGCNGCNGSVTANVTANSLVYVRVRVLSNL
jgi:hypothetical protein